MSQAHQELTDREETPPGIRRMQVQIPAARTHLPGVAEVVRAFGLESDWPEDFFLHIELILEELLVNIMDYAYPDRSPGDIHLTLETHPDRVLIKLQDDGVRFDPFGHVSPVLALPLADRPIGGLGIHLVRCLTEFQSYQYLDGLNQVELSKRLV